MTEHKKCMYQNDGCYECPNQRDCPILNGDKK